MQCRAHCGACCIAISIKQPFYGMPGGKPAGVSCVHLDADMACRLFGDSRRPGLCEAFTPQAAYCGENKSEAMARLTELEHQTLPGYARKASV